MVYHYLAASSAFMLGAVGSYCKECGWTTTQPTAGARCAAAPCRRLRLPFHWHPLSIPIETPTTCKGKNRGAAECQSRQRLGSVDLCLATGVKPTPRGTFPPENKGAADDRWACEVACAVGENSVVLLQPPSTFSRCFNKDKKEVSSEYVYGPVAG